MATIAHWFRRDLRLSDNTALAEALKTNQKVILVFIFDTNITRELPVNDPRLGFIYENLLQINNQLNTHQGGVLIRKGDPFKIWKELILDYQLQAIYTNIDYEPYATKRDKEIKRLCSDYNIDFYTFKDQVIFEKDEISKSDGKPYTVYTPFKNKWLDSYNNQSQPVSEKKLAFNKIVKPDKPFPSIQSIGFQVSDLKIRNFNLKQISSYDQTRDFPGEDGTSYIGPHLRFGTVSVRKITQIARSKNAVYLNELIWREFFMQILFHYPKVVNESFKSKYDNIKWINDQKQFERWCNGETGFPMVDAGMRQLNQTGFMHNRARMVTASFLVKHLLIDWRWGESYFAEKLLDYELSSNNGNWQWAAGTGCDAAPYFRVFNPFTQQKKFDLRNLYVNKWIPELNTSRYPDPIIDHSFARKRAIDTYKKALN